MAEHAGFVRRRELLRLGLGAAACWAMPARARAAAGGFDLLVARDGRRGSVATLAAALREAESAGRPFRIRVERGLYREKLHVRAAGLTIVGAPGAVLSCDASAGRPGPDGKPWGTFGSGSLTVEAPDVTLDGLTIVNAFDFLHSTPSGEHGGRQAVALALGPGADRTIVRNCTLDGYQDTFYLREGRALVEHCRISGGTDFVFGGAAALIRNCEIVSRFVPGVPIQGYVAAPSTPEDQPAGLVFERCRLVREPRVPDESVFLGRPWRAGGNMKLTGMAAYLDCWMDRHIRPEGWTAMRYAAPGGPSGWLTPEQARLYEQGSRGPGAGRASAIRRGLPPELSGIAEPARIFGDWRPTPAAIG